MASIPDNEPTTYSLTVSLVGSADALFASVTEIESDDPDSRKL